MPKRRDAEYLKRGYLLPETINPETNISVCVPIPNDINHIRAFLGQIDMLGYWWTWEMESTKSGTLAAAVWRGIAEIVRARIDNQEECEMTFDCCTITTVVMHRVNEDTGRLEISVDNGVTWTQDPQDPGVTAIQMIPPVTSGAAADKCNAAANARNSVEDWVAEINAQKELGVSLLEFVTAVALAVVSVFLELATLGTATALIIPIILAVAKLVYEMDNATFANYWTTDVYDSITCAFYCNMLPSGSIPEENFFSVITQIVLTTTGGTQQKALINMLLARGIVGMNNMASIGTGTADCSDCDCTCWTHFQVVTGDHLTEPYYEGYESYQSEQGIPGTDYAINIMSPNKNICCQVLDVKFDLVGNTGNNFTPFSIFKWDCGQDQEGINSGGALVGSCVNRIQPMTHPVSQAGQIFVMSVLFGDCP